MNGKPARMTDSFSSIENQLIELLNNESFISTLGFVLEQEDSPLRSVGGTRGGQ